jgi:hypothetical protein
MGSWGILLQMTLHQSVVNSILNWPNLFGCRTDVLEHYFCTIGNGHAWENGELNEQPNYENLLHDATEQIQEWEKRMKPFFGDKEDIYKASLARVRVSFLADRVAAEFRIKHAEDLAYIKWSNFYLQYKVKENIATRLRGSVYPLCEYSLMANVPDDVKPDWLAGVREMIYAVFAEQTDYKHYDNNIKFASECLTNLHERFGSPER